MGFDPNTSEFKRVLALVRNADFAHAGEAEAISLTLDRVGKDSSRRVLDVGCGRGGTAEFVRRGGWGEIVGIDIDAESVAYGRTRYPGCSFLIGDARELGSVVDGAFELVYMFNVFYAFNDHVGVLGQCRGVAARAAMLVLFDYVDRGGYRSAPLIVDGTDVIPNPIQVSRLEQNLESAGWALEGVRDLDADYERWYAQLVDRIVDQHDAIVDIGDDAVYERALELYGGQLNLIREGRLGGAAVYATRCDCGTDDVARTLM